MKRVLVVHYSQTGQLADVLDALVEPLAQDPQVDLTRLCIEPEQPYPFPWPFFRFFDAFPESVYLDPPPLKPLGLAPEARFDLIILGYQAWFLSPSLPISGFLKSDPGRQVLKDTPVVTVVACRNMWLTAQEKVSALIEEAGGDLLDHVALVDSGSAIAGFITTPRWLLSGRKEAFLGLPPAGISKADIADTRRFGRALRFALRQGDLRAQAPLLRGLRAAEVDDRLIASERIGHRSFLIWGKLLRKIGPAGDRKRVPVLAVYAIFLVLMIITVVPLGMLVRALLRPVLRRRLQRQKQALERPSGSEADRIPDFSHD